MAQRIDWTALKIDYLEGDYSYAELADKYTCSLDAIKRRAANEKWKDRKNDITVEVEEKIKEIVVQSMIEPKLRHQKIAEGMMAKVEEALLNPKLRIMSMKDLKEVASAAVEIHRKSLDLENERPAQAPIQIMIMTLDGKVVGISDV